MKKTITLKVKISPERVRQTLAIITGKAYSDEELEKDFFGDATELDLEQLLGPASTENEMAVIVTKMLEKAED
nr:hypothetical protein [uncultured Draconibacterium sp.]